MRRSVRLAATLGSIATPGLAAVWFSGIASAQGLHDHGSQAIQVGIPAQELAASTAHAATLGAVVFLAGLVAFVTLVWRPANPTEDTERGKEAVDLLRRWMWALVGLLVVAGLVEVSLYAVRASGEAFGPALLEEALLDTRVGQLWVVRLALAIATATAATYAAQKLVGAGYRWGAALGASALLLMTLTWQSHAAAEGGFLPFAADWLHVTAASLWMGGLLGFPILLLGPLRPMPVETRAKLLGRIVPRFSKVATMAVMILILTGLVAILLHVPSLSALTNTPYGRALAMKLGFSVFLFAAGGLNLMLRGRDPFGHLVSAELLLAIGVFVATGFLTSLPPADATQSTAENEAPQFDEGLRQPPMPLPPDSAGPDPNIAVRPTAKTASNVVVRLSGTPGTSYSGVYKGPVEGTTTVEGTLRDKPSDYEAKIEDDAPRGVSAAFEKIGSEAGTLKLEILADGEVVAERETSSGSDTIAASWTPRTETAGDSP